MMGQTNRVVWGLCAVLLVACKDNEGDTGSGMSTGMMTEGTATTGPDATTGEPTGGSVGTTEPTTGSSTEATTAEGTSGTTGGGAILEDCQAGVDAEWQQIEHFCGCAVADGDYPDVRTCLMDSSTVNNMCTCGVYAMFPDEAAYVECYSAAEIALAACLKPLMCGAVAGETGCFDGYFLAIDACEVASKSPAAEIALQCFGATPFMCMSGETFPDYWVCDGEADCMDMSDEVDCFFMCGSGEEIPKEWKCDGEPDCMDMSDELNCP